eukprot:1140807-Pelagomonas_calceolata.AAC.1
MLAGAVLDELLAGVLLLFPLFLGLVSWRGLLAGPDWGFGAKPFCVVRCFLFKRCNRASTLSRGSSLAFGSAGWRCWATPAHRESKQVCNSIARSYGLAVTTGLWTLLQPVADPYRM